MPISDLVNLVINLQEPAITAPGFGTPALVADFDPAVDTLFGADLFKVITKNTFKTVLAALGLTSSDSEWQMVNTHFAQARSPEQALLGRRADPVAQQANVSVDVYEDGTYTVTINGNDATHLASSSTTTAVRDALVIAVNGLTDPVTASNGAGADDLDIDADEAGESFTTAVDHSATPSNISFTTPIANVGLAEDIIAWKLERNDWYFLVLHEKTDGQIREVANAIESEVKMAFTQTNDPDVQGMASGDLASELSALGLVRTVLMWHDDDSEHPHAGIVGKMAPTVPGDEAWAKQTLTTVTGFKPTDSVRLRAKHTFYLEAFEAIDGSTAVTMTTNAQVVSGQWIDLVWGRDHLQSLIESSVLTAMRDAPKIPYTTAGAGILDAAVRGPLIERSDAEGSGLVIFDTIVVNIATPETQSAASKTARDLPGSTFSATLQGDVETMDITGDLVV